MSPKAAVSLAQSALDDLGQIQEWYVRQGVPDVGKRLVREIFQHIDILEDSPDMGRTVPEFDNKFLCELIHTPFRIVYRREPGGVKIVRIWRSERILDIPPDS